MHHARLVKYSLFFALLLFLVIPFFVTLPSAVDDLKPSRLIQHFSPRNDAHLSVVQRLQRRYVIAANFYNSASVLPNMFREWRKLVDLLGPDRIFVSIYENGSQDDTKQLLNQFKSELELRHVPHSIVTCDLLGSSWWSYRRITDRYLKYAALRNVVLRPIFSESFPFRFDLDNTFILFFNDIFFTADQVLNLLSTQDGRYDMACAMDFYFSFYDQLATRDIEGNHFSDLYPFVRHSESQRKLLRKEPFEVFSCWNGLISLAAKPFIEQHIRFRVSNPRKCECPQSECLLIGLDFRIHGYSRIFINPQVKVTYDPSSERLQKWVLPVINPIISWANSITVAPEEMLPKPNQRRHGYINGSRVGSSHRAVQVACALPGQWEPPSMDVFTNATCAVDDSYEFGSARGSTWTAHKKCSPEVESLIQQMRANSTFALNQLENQFIECPTADKALPLNQC
eukprot:GILK01011239.1.p1 GENE.GILK01011239.1~~GILK01011239.1.p1  ORF type:complete len:455 (+),score=84.63 GILK01011239.1:45-1409(+)